MKELGFQSRLSHKYIVHSIILFSCNSSSHGCAIAFHRLVDQAVSQIDLLQFSWFFFLTKQKTWTDYQCQERTSTTWSIANIITVAPCRIRSPTMPTHYILASQYPRKTQHGQALDGTMPLLTGKWKSKINSDRVHWSSWLATPKYTTVVPVPLQADAGQLVYRHSLVLQKGDPSSFPMKSSMLKVREPLRHMSKQNKGTPTDYKTRHKVANPSTGCVVSLSLGKGLFAQVKWLYAWFSLLYSMRKNIFKISELT